MITDASTVQSAVAHLFGEGVTIAKRRGVGGGCINATTRLDLSNGEIVFLKENSSKFENMFLAEAKGLEALQVEGGPTVPRPLAVHSTDESQYILMTYIEPGRRRADFAEQFGRAFAQMHKNDASEYFGFAEDNYIGSTPQINKKESSWPVFFGEHRLGYQIRLAQKCGLASSNLVDKTEKLITSIDEFVPADARPSVLHGDLWSGNVMVGPDGFGAIIDPATYFGHFEADLAMTQLFGSQDSIFYSSYSEVNPISPEYREYRKEIYNLYHILNHLNIFGMGYASQAMSIVKRFV